MNAVRGDNRRGMSRTTVRIAGVTAAVLAAVALVVWWTWPGDDERAAAPPQVAAAPAAPASTAPAKGVRVGGGRRRSADEKTPDSNVQQAPPARLLVRVQGARGPLEPVAGAAVYVMDASGSDWRAVTANAGTARFDELPAGKTVVHTEIAGKKVFDRTVEVKSGEEQSLDVVAMRVGVVRGIVRDPDGRPVDTGWVRLVNGGPGTFAAGYNGNTGDDGGFEVADVPCGGTFTLMAGAPGWADSAPIEGVRLEGDPPSATREVVLQRLSSLVVRLVGPSGEDVGAAVWLDGRNALPRRASGNEYFRDSLMPGDHTITIEPKAFPKAIRQFSVAPGERADVEVRLEAGVAIEGVVVDDNGAPVANATVIAGPAAAANADADALGRRALRMHRGSESTAQTGTDGAFRLERLSPGEYALSAATESAASGAFVTVVAPASGIRVPVVAIASVRFHVVGDGDIGGIRSVRVSECPAGAPPNRAWRDTYCVMRGGADDTGAGQWVSVYSISQNARALMICGDDYAPVVVAFTPVPGRTVDLGDIHVASGLSLKGRVVATDGSPVGGVQVSAMLALGATRQCVAGNDGTFVLEHLARGPVVVRAAKEGLMGVAVLDVGHDAPKAEVVVRTVGVLEGVVRDGRGAAVARADVRVRYGFADADDEMGAWQYLTTGGDGRFATPLIAGRCLVSAGGAWVTADVAEGGKATVTLEKP